MSGEATVKSLEAACEVLHIAYEHAAFEQGWQTNPKSRKPWAHVPEAKKQAMRLAVLALWEWMDEAPAAVVGGEQHGE
jgi:hypothetical protein